MNNNIDNKKDPKKYNWQVISSVISSCAIIVAIVIFFANQYIENQRFINNFKVINCLNLEKAIAFIPGKEQTWDYNIRYDTSFYHNNWSNVLDAINYASSSLRQSSSSVVSYLKIINSMDISNRIVDRSEIQSPYYKDLPQIKGSVLSDVSGEAEKIINLFNGLGINIDYCREVYKINDNS